MKKLILLVGGGVLLSMVSFAVDAVKSPASDKKTSLAAAMDPLVVAPDMYKLLFENERVRVMEVTFQPGQKIGKHSHPEHFAYVLSEGKLKIYKPEGTSSDADLKVGQVMWIPAETHWAENTGTTPVRLLVNELKEAKAPVSSQQKAQ